MSIPVQYEMPSVESIRYELERFSISAYFAPEVLQYMKMRHRMVEGHHVAELVGFVATWREQRLLKTPANWWEHLKLRWFPAWALKRWPVLYDWHDAAVILPRVPIVRPEYHTVEFPVWRDSGLTNGGPIHADTATG